jgi:outer membrane murein-binding lipoprotein Lpp
MSDRDRTQGDAPDGYAPLRAQIAALKSERDALAERVAAAERERSISCARGCGRPAYRPVLFCLECLGDPGAKSRADEYEMIRVECMRQRERAESAERALAEMTRERDEALKLAYIGDHYFPENTWKKCAEDLRLQVRSLESDLSKLRAESAALAETNARMREALKPFASLASVIPAECRDEEFTLGRTVGDFRRAAQALAENGGGA